MNFTEIYIKQMTKSPVREEKYRIGYCPGDYILGENNTPILIGFDCLGIEKYLFSGVPSIRLRAIEPLPTFCSSDIEPTITIKVAELTVKVLHTYGPPVWLPTSDDWWEMIDWSKFSSFEIGKLPTYPNKYFLNVFNDETILLFTYEAGSIFELLSAFWHHERGLEWRDGEWIKI